MSRKIKFKAWNGEQLRDVNTIGWTNGELDWIDTSKNHGPIDEDIKLMQFTGLKDMNGVDIYEGDVLWSDHSGEYTYVEYSEGAFYIVHVVTSEKTLLSREHGDWILKGNIYENKNLLEEK